MHSLRKLDIVYLLSAMYRWVLPPRPALHTPNRGYHRLLTDLITELEGLAVARNYKPQVCSSSCVTIINTYHSNKTTLCRVVIQENNTEKNFVHICRHPLNLSNRDINKSAALTLNFEVDKKPVVAYIGVVLKKVCTKIQFIMSTHARAEQYKQTQNRERKHRTIPWSVKPNDRDGVQSMNNLVIFTLSTLWDFIWHTAYKLTLSSLCRD